MADYSNLVDILGVLNQEEGGELVKWGVAREIAFELTRAASGLDVSPITYWVRFLAEDYMDHLTIAKGEFVLTGQIVRWDKLKGTLEWYSMKEAVDRAKKVVQRKW